mgnify:CR=1 FL=1
MINRMICGKYSSTGWVQGVPNKLIDMNYCYADFPAIIKRAGKNNFDIDTAVVTI